MVQQELLLTHFILQSDFLHWMTFTLPLISSFLTGLLHLQTNNSARLQVHHDLPTQVWGASMGEEIFIIHSDSSSVSLDNAGICVFRSFVCVGISIWVVILINDMRWSVFIVLFLNLTYKLFLDCLFDTIMIHWVGFHWGLLIFSISQVICNFFLRITLALLCTLSVSHRIPALVSSSISSSGVSLQVISITPRFTFIIAFSDILTSQNKAQAMCCGYDHRCNSLPPSMLGCLDVMSLWPLLPHIPQLCMSELPECFIICNWNVGMLWLNMNCHVIFPHC